MPNEVKTQENNHSEAYIPMNTTITIKNKDIETVTGKESANINDLVATIRDIALNYVEAAESEYAEQMIYDVLRLKRLAEMLEKGNFKDAEL